MARIVRSPDALQDIEDIWSYIAGDNRVAADRFVRTIEERIQRLVDYPLIGRPRDEFHPGLRSVPLGSYLLFYRPIVDGIEVVRILHGARDLPQIFAKKRS